MIKVKDPKTQRSIEMMYGMGQGHVFRFWDLLSPKEQEDLLSQISSIDLDLLARLIEEDILPRSHCGEVEDFEPAPYIHLPKTEEEKGREEEARRVGEELISEGKVACLLVAGGQSTRLGYRGPKGKFGIGPITGKSLFQLYAERIMAAGRRYKVRIPWCIMTSPYTDEETRRFFKEHNFFGLREDDVIFLVQGMLPSVDFDGKLILDGPSHIAMSPNGHGGSIHALKEEGVIDRLREEGISEIFYFQVDNPLVKVLDPVFIGYHTMERADISFKVVRRLTPDEKVGVMGYKDGRLSVIEYSELPPSLAEARNPDGSLRFDAGSIAIHILRVGFIKDTEFDLPYHPARKKIPFINEDGRLITPRRPNGIKFESFVFDVLKWAKGSIIMEVRRREEYSPIKNREGSSSPETARQDMMNLYADWLEYAGVSVPRDKDGNVDGRVEISPLFALDKEELAKKIDRGLYFNKELYLG
jgi:UDP-N-acetylglucosamine/UDP-N-acetylgalactosamine diphosphorylase